MHVDFIIANILAALKLRYTELAVSVAFIVVYVVFFSILHRTLIVIVEPLYHWYDCGMVVFTEQAMICRQRLTVQVHNGPL